MAGSRSKYGKPCTECSALLHNHNFNLWFNFAFAALSFRVFYSINREAYRNNRQRCLEMLTFSSFSSIRSCRVTKRKAKRRFWIRPGRARIWWDKLLTKTVGLNGWIGSVSSLRNRVVFDAVSMS